jgi:predicted Zn finger-like uncharacterized protein
MILSCSACATRYVVDPALLGPEGRTVRCANCGHQWHASAPMALPDNLDEPVRPPVAPEPFRPRGPGSNLPGFPRRARAPGVAIAWAALALAVLVLLAAGVAARNAVVAAWPPAERLYAAVGLIADPPGTGLEFRNVTTARRLESDREVVVIEGDVVNVSNRDRQVPHLRAALTAGDHDINSWTFDATQSRLLPGESARFVTRTDEPSEEATGLSLRFDDGK